MKSKEQKRTEGAKRNEAWAKLTNAEKLAYLDKHNLTATRQRRKLANA